ncbi:MAG: DUF1566 domain-containing protein [Spirochaetes bacterium]|nr:DUF1566 domain-containing protein [Spirochaetota bacterium]
MKTIKLLIIMIILAISMTCTGYIDIPKLEEELRGLKSAYVSTTTVAPTTTTTYVSTTTLEATTTTSTTIQGSAGGYVFYDKGYVSDGWRYLEAAPVSTEWSSQVWGGYGAIVNGADGTAIGSGEQNTIDIVTQFGASEPYEDITDYAAKLCLDLVYGGYDDWFLPSRDELNLIYTNLYLEGIGGFVFSSYWSSSECYVGSAWGKYFGDGEQSDNNKNFVLRVRAVRAF